MKTKLIVFMFLFTIFAFHAQGMADGKAIKNTPNPVKLEQLTLTETELLRLRVADYETAELKARFQKTKEQILTQLNNILSKKKIELRKIEERLGIKLEDYILEADGILIKKKKEVKGENE